MTRENALCGNEDEPVAVALVAWWPAGLPHPGLSHSGRICEIRVKDTDFTFRRDNCF